jgi:hypothetical protein
MGRNCGASRPAPPRSAATWARNWVSPPKLGCRKATRSSPGATRAAALSASRPTAMTRSGRSRPMSALKSASPAARSVARWARLEKGASGACGCKGKTFHTKKASSPASASQTTAAVRSGSGGPRVGRCAFRPKPARCCEKCASSVKARPVRRPPRQPKSRPSQSERVPRRSAAWNSASRIFARACGARALSWTAQRSAKGLKACSKRSAQRSERNCEGVMTSLLPHSPSPRLRGEGWGEGLRRRAHPKIPRPLSLTLSPQAGRGNRA